MTVPVSTKNWSGKVILLTENHLNREFTPDKPNSSWVADITYIYTREGWLYLATIMDLYSRKIIGWFLKRQINKRNNHCSITHNPKTEKGYIHLSAITVQKNMKS